MNTVFTHRAMKMSEHDDDSWNDIFGNDDPRNYAVVSPTNRVVDTHLTFTEAKALAAECNEPQEEDY